MNVKWCYWIGLIGVHGSSNIHLPRSCHVSLSNVGYNKTRYGYDLSNMKRKLCGSSYIGTLPVLYVGTLSTEVLPRSDILKASMIGIKFISLQTHKAQRSMGPANWARLWDFLIDLLAQKLWRRHGDFLLELLRLRRNWTIYSSSDWWNSETAQRTCWSWAGLGDLLKV